MLLRGEPRERAPDLAGEPPPQARSAPLAIDEVEADQPPQRRIDAAEVPEVGLLSREVHELRNLAVGRLVAGQRLEPGLRRAFELAVARHGHPERAHGGVAREDRGVAALLCGRGGMRREYSSRTEIGLQQFDAAPTLGDKALVIRLGSRGDGAQGATRAADSGAESPSVKTRIAPGKSANASATRTRPSAICKRSPLSAFSSTVPSPRKGTSIEVSRHTCAPQGNSPGPSTNRANRRPAMTMMPAPACRRAYATT